MKEYAVHISSQARLNILELEHVIVHEYHAPLTAKRYVTGLYARIFSLSSFAESVKVSDKKEVLRFGANARSIQYKKMVIIYTVHHTLVVVRAVIPAALIQ